MRETPNMTINNDRFHRFVFIAYDVHITPPPTRRSLNSEELESCEVKRDFRVNKRGGQRRQNFSSQTLHTSNAFCA